MKKIIAEPGVETDPQFDNALTDAKDMRVSKLWNMLRVWSKLVQKFEGGPVSPDCACKIGGRSLGDLVK